MAEADRVWIAGGGYEERITRIDRPEPLPDTSPMTISEMERSASGGLWRYYQDRARLIVCPSCGHIMEKVYHEPQPIADQVREAWRCECGERLEVTTSAWPRSE